MDTWQSISGFAWHRGLPYLIGLLLIVALAVYRFSPASRRSAFNSLILFAICMAGLLLSGVAHHLQFNKLADVLQEIFILIEGIISIRVVGMLIFRVVLPAARFTPPSILEDMLVILGYIVWGMLRLRYAGMDLSGIVTTSAVMTAVIAFSMQDTLGNILGGLAIELDGSIHIGDWVKVDDVIGRVVDIRWRSTSVETRNWETVVIPNGVLMKNKFSVLGKRSGQPLQWRRWVWFSVGYYHLPALVIETVETALISAEIPRMSKQPLPNCLFMDFDSGSARYAVRYWLTDLANDDPTDSAVRAHIYAALQRAGIHMPLPEHNVHIFKENEKQEEARHARSVAHRVALLREIDLFRSFTDSELQTVAERLKHAIFVKGDVMTRQGAIAHWLYIVTEGEADVMLETESGYRPVSTIRAGSFFGEMGMMTGAPRSATVIAKTQVECYRLDKASFEGIIRSRPALAEEITEVLATRQTALSQVQQDFSNEKQGQTLRQSEILSKVKSFFGL
ncbi:MAG: mechanosensitive ion channel family protein [Sulfuricellaceae bacterium]|nr:mechanosensitive ion channel family protein [Sulfuricellaceae bacterium]